MKFENFPSIAAPYLEEQNVSRREGIKKEGELLKFFNNKEKILIWMGVFGLTMGTIAKQLYFNWNDLNNNSYVEQVAEEKQSNGNPEVLDGADKIKNALQNEPRTGIYQELSVEDEEELQLDLRSIHEIIDYNQEGRIEFNLNTAQELKKYWKNEYLKYPQKLASALEKMQPYENELREIFKKYDIPDDYIYLAIAESYFQPVKSYKSAGGYYQLMPEIGRNLGLKINSKIDERNNPIKSCEAAAKLLKEEYTRYGDWKLALAAYNGSGYVRSYKKFAEEKGEKLSYEGFLNFREENINKYRDEVRNKNYDEYVAEKGDTMWQIARRLNIPIKTLTEANKRLDVKKIKKGSVVRIPILDKKQYFEYGMACSNENLRYPEKFFAILELIKSGKVIAKNTKEHEGEKRETKSGVLEQVDNKKQV